MKSDVWAELWSALDAKAASRTLATAGEAKRPDVANKETSLFTTTPFDLVRGTATPNHSAPKEGLDIWGSYASIAAFHPFRPQATQSRHGAFVLGIRRLSVPTCTRPVLTGVMTSHSRHVSRPNCWLEYR